MSADEIVRLISLSFSLIISLAGLFAALIKVIKTKKWDTLKQELYNLVLKAEETENLSAEEKKNSVLSWAQDFCKSQGMAFDAEKVESIIDTLEALILKGNQKQNTLKGDNEDISKKEQKSDQ